ncbi:MAG: hypothetical protein A2655_01490 [Candidatus Yanofskybacteria bacterium RIFCSPHIGHO2_01_FULL_43_42]|uniref:Uncharacterized protein n=1 Tax=Candidatus Yanofskybacteria bacterium RIFCSPLOWO2_01_FULL_43_22 TaxID=1802695 RepID=A0A1F8GIM3_9BACT|nr:MAG: hypothetical protein A2655_01490 [Candidatus Yanofskybacteria bacterium RIFCSPHIGHO2_01_FULL_43_42]OGN13154.1 MAG: hypothetical protein A3D48_02400 [Candidatus Yanofskybacteria bacterium RIFCSPHIGHO2_02_FULL_43_17]OGN24568.1 MAG: hypothetical protein A3A13_00620 [Candidatus Yanofskybacteria bacterium RIFCSPLOWO2_01_FULL_43_22]
MSIGFSLFVKEAILFGLTLALGLYAAYRYSLDFIDIVQEGMIRFTFTDLVVLLILFSAIFFVSRHKKIARFSFKFFLVLIVFSGTQVILGTILPSPWDLAIAILFVFIFAIGANVLVHDLGIILGIAGIAAVFGLSISIEFGLVLLVVLSLYDIVAVYVTKHMVTMARSMIEGGAVFGFLIPFEFKGFFRGGKEARAGIGESFMILGSGDIGLPLIFAVSLIRVSVLSAIITATFSLLGLFLTHLLFLNQEKRRAMAALPPIATMTIIGYLISMVI